MIKFLTISVCLGAIDGLSFGFLHLSSYAYTPAQQQTGALLYGILMVLSTFLLQYLLTAPSHPERFSGNKAPPLWKRVVSFFQAVQGPRVLLVAFIIGMGVWLNDTLRAGPTIGLSDTLRVGARLGLSIGLSAGLIYGLINLALSTQMEDIRPTERLRWTWKSLRRCLFNSRHLRITLLLTCISIIFIGLGVAPSIGLSVGLSIGLSYWCLLGLYQGVVQERIDNEHRRTANQGIHRSLRNSVIMGISGGAMIGLIGILSYWLSNLLSQGLRNLPNYGLGYGLILGISGALLIYMLTGGLAVLRHYTIRLLLWRSHTFPWQAPQFLDDATARFLLRRIGGGYSFTHRLLLDHLADGER